MKTENKILTQRARETLKGKWGLAVGTMFLYSLIVMGVQSIPAIGILGLLITGPMNLGLVIFALSLSRNENPKVEQIFEGFNRFTDSLVAYLLVLIFTFLWTLLLIVPGIIAALSYSMTFYILKDEQSITPSEAIKLSKKMMMGNKWKYFKLQLRFIGWGILSVLTLGIGFLWLFPYIQVTNAKFYDDLKNSTLPHSTEPAIQ